MDPMRFVGQLNLETLIYNDASILLIVVYAWKELISFDFYVHFDAF